MPDACRGRTIRLGPSRPECRHRPSAPSWLWQALERHSRQEPLLESELLDTFGERRAAPRRELACGLRRAFGVGRAARVHVARGHAKLARSLVEVIARRDADVRARL